jgi:hypothetical protein
MTARIGLYLGCGRSNSIQTGLVCRLGLRSSPRPNVGFLVSTLTLGTACILAAGGYVDGTQPWEERGARRDSVIVMVVVCIVRALRTEGLVFWAEMVQCAEGRGMRELQARSCSRGSQRPTGKDRPEKAAVRRVPFPTQMENIHSPAEWSGPMPVCVVVGLAGDAVGGAAGSSSSARQSVHNNSCC